MSITRALSQLRWINFFLALIVIVLKIFGFFAGFNIYSILLNCFCILFCGILALYELQMKKLTKKFRVLYGFLYTYIGRAAYVVLYFIWSVFLFYSVGTIVIASGNMLNVIIGFVVIVVGLYDFEFLLIYVVVIMSSLLFFILLLRRKEERLVMILLSLILLVKA